MLEESKTANSADQIDPLAALRLETQMGSRNLPIEKIDKILENEMPCTREEILKGEHIANTAIPLGKLKSWQLGSMVPLREFHIRIYLMAHP